MTEVQAATLIETLGAILAALENVAFWVFCSFLLLAWCAGGLAWRTAWVALRAKELWAIAFVAILGGTAESACVFNFADSINIPYSGPELSHEVEGQGVYAGQGSIKFEFYGSCEDGSVHVFLYFFLGADGEIYSMATGSAEGWYGESIPWTPSGESAWLDEALASSAASTVFSTAAAACVFNVSACPITSAVYNPGDNPPSIVISGNVCGDLCGYDSGSWEVRFRCAEGGGVAVSGATALMYTGPGDVNPDAHVIIGYLGKLAQGEAMTGVTLVCDSDPCVPVDLSTVGQPCGNGGHIAVRQDASGCDELYCAAGPNPCGDVPFCEVGEPCGNWEDGVGEWVASVDPVTLCPRCDCVPEPEVPEECLEDEDGDGVPNWNDPDWYTEGELPEWVGEAVGGPCACRTDEEGEESGEWKQENPPDACPYLACECDPDPCADKGGDTDGDGCCDDEDLDPGDEEMKCDCKQSIAERLEELREQVFGWFSGSLTINEADAPEAIWNWSFAIDIPGDERFSVFSFAANFVTGEIVAVGGGTDISDGLAGEWDDVRVLIRTTVKVVFGVYFFLLFIGLLKR